LPERARTPLPVIVADTGAVLARLDADDTRHLLSATGSVSRG
jgi:hypothetical protein